MDFVSDEELALRYGAYASFQSPFDPAQIDDFGDSHVDEMDRLLDHAAGRGAALLDLGCGAGQTLCRLAPKVGEIWGVDLEEPLLASARARVERCGVTNARLVLGDTTNDSTVAQLPDAHFDFVYSRRGPFLTHALMRKLKPEACFVVEMAQDVLGLKEIFGRRPVLPRDNYQGADAAVQHHASLGFLPVSVKDYYFHQYFRDAEHLAAYLRTTPANLSNWWMAPRPFDPDQDAAALELYARYNATSRGVRVIQRRKVYLFHRAPVDYYPADGAVSG